MASRLLVNLGCGQVWHPAWANFDLAPADAAVRAFDATAPLPLANDSADAVYHAHLLEHLPRAQAQTLLGECRRVLRPGGILRVVVPDLEELARRYLASRDSGDPLVREWAEIELLDQLTRNRTEGEMGDFLRTAPWREHPEIYARVGTEIAAAGGGRGSSVITKFSSDMGGTPMPRGMGVPPVGSDEPEQNQRTAGGGRVSRPALRDRLAHKLAGLRFRLAAAFLNARERVALTDARFRLTGENHRWMYDRVSLAALLRTVGFADVAVVTATTSRIAEFAACHLDTAADGTERHPGSLYVEARKP
ncbi:MAG: methyltransferase domain-containing protein [Opitutae bacterium]|nr:methyltransferase domain-containing protein [Opitutae bacterium]